MEKERVSPYPSWKNTSSQNWAMETTFGWGTCLPSHLSPFSFLDFKITLRKSMPTYRHISSLTLHFELCQVRKSSGCEPMGFLHPHYFHSANHCATGLTVRSHGKRKWRVGGGGPGGGEGGQNGKAWNCFLNCFLMGVQFVFLTLSSGRTKWRNTNSLVVMKILTLDTIFQSPPF